jgi:arylsulfatase A-like enzyme
MMPTFADVVGVAAPEDIDGVSFLPTLLGEAGQAERDHLYWEYHGLWNGAQAVRIGQWKGVRLGGHDDPDAPIELYDLVADPNETTDVGTDHPDIVAHMRAVMESRTESRVERWNFPR